MRLLQLRVVGATLCVALLAATASAGSILVSIGIRETGNPNNLPIGANGGSANGIEWVNRDGQTLNADGTWQLFTFIPAVDPLTAFAGSTANGVLDNDWGVLEHIRFGNVTDDRTRYRIWIDDITNTTSAGPVNFGSFEGAALGSEVIFQEPRFSGSTASGLQLTPNVAAVTDAMAFTGTQSNEVEFEFIDDTPAPGRWLRLTTFNTAIGGNPLVRFREPVVGGIAIPSTITFMAKAITIPEPSSLMLAGLTCLGLLAARRRSA